MIHSLTRLPDRRLLGGILIGVVIGVVGVGAVTASPAASNAVSTAAAQPAAITLAAPTTPGGATAAAAAPIRARALRAFVRDNFRVTVSATSKAGTKDILYVRGALAIGNGTVTVTLPDDSTQAFTTDATTIVRDQGKTVALSDLTSGERAMVFGLRNADGTWTAKLIRCVREAAAAPKANASASPAP